MKNILNFLILSNITLFYSQNNDSETFNFVNPSTKLYVIGEEHGDADTELQIQLLDYILKNDTIDYIAVEYSVETGKIFNEYIQNGSREKDVNIILSLVRKSVANKQIEILNYLKEYNKSKTKKLELIGIDLLGFYKLKRQFVALSLIFPELKEKNICLVDKYIFSKRMKNYTKKESLIIIDSLINDLNLNNIIYKQILKDRIDDYEENLYQAKFELSNLSIDVYDVFREGIMLENFHNIIGPKNKTIMMCGASHAILKENDKWYYGYPITRITSSISKTYPNQVFSIIIQCYEKNKLFRFFEFNLLSNPMSHYIKDPNCSYVIIDGELLKKNELAYERCNMIIIHNNDQVKKKKRKRVG